MSEKTYYGSTDGREKHNIEDLLDNAVNDRHNYRPTFKFYKEDSELEPIYFGIELEVNTPESDYRSNAVKLLTKVNQTRRHFYCKRDGSLGTGFEFNSMPMSLNYFKRFDVGYMNDMFKNAKVFTTDECGFHVHISRESILNVPRFHETLYNLLPFLLFISNRKQYDSISRFTSLFSESSGRYNDDDGDSPYSRSSLAMRQTTTGAVNKGLRTSEVAIYGNSRYSAHSKRKSNIKVPARYIDNDDRYSFVNYTNPNTIEVRLFKGTTDWSYVLNVLELLELIVRYTNNNKSFDSIYDLMKILPDNNLKAFITTQNEKMSKELLRAYWANTRGELFNAGYNFSMYRIPAKNAQAGDICISNRDLLDIIKINVMQYSDDFAQALNETSMTSEIVEVCGGALLCSARNFRHSSRLFLINEDELSKVSVFRRVLYVFAPFVRSDNRYLLSALATRLKKLDMSSFERTYIGNNGVYHEQNNRVNLTANQLGAVRFADYRDIDAEIAGQLAQSYRESFLTLRERSATVDPHDVLSEGTVELRRYVPSQVATDNPYYQGLSFDSTDYDFALEDDEE